MRKEYRSPALAEYGRLRDITAGIGGDAPDVGGLNIVCVTGTLLSGTLTVTISCTTTGGGGGQFS